MESVAKNIHDRGMLHGEFLRHIVETFIVSGVAMYAILCTMQVEVVDFVAQRRLLEGYALPFAWNLVVAELEQGVETVTTEDDILILATLAIDHQATLDIHTTILMEIDDRASIDGEGDIRIDHKTAIDHERSLTLIIDYGILFEHMII